MHDDLKAIGLTIFFVVSFVFMIIIMVCITTITVAFTASYTTKKDLEISMVEAQMPAKKGREG